MAQLGRPTKLTDELIQEIVDNISVVKYLGIASEAAGISRHTANRWNVFGREHDEKEHPEGDECTVECGDRMPAYRKFFTSIKKAQALATKTDVNEMIDIGRQTKNWLPFAWRTERTNPEFNLKTTVEHEHKGSIEILQKVLPPDQKRRLLEVAQRAILLEQGDDGIYSEANPQNTEED